MKLKIGDKVKINLPKPLPNWVINWKFYKWADHLLANDQQIATVLGIHANHQFLYKGSPICDCIDAEVPVIADGLYNRTTLLLDWIQPINSKTPCDCPMAKILTTGCQNKNHI